MLAEADQRYGNGFSLVTLRRVIGAEVESFDLAVQVETLSLRIHASLFAGRPLLDACCVTLACCGFRFHRALISQNGIRRGALPVFFF